MTPYTPDHTRPATDPARPRTGALDIAAIAAGRGNATVDAPGAPPTVTPAAHAPSRRLVPATEIAELLGQHRPTDEQLAVIEAPLEPVLVVAGAGSGKTETMSARVVYLIVNGLVEPDEVLGLTFTRKAAGELGERIRRRLRTLTARMRDAGQHALLGDLGEQTPDAALLASMRRPTVATYNSYAAGLVKEHGLRLGIEPGARLLGEASQWQLAQEVVERWTGELGADAALSTVVDAVRNLSGSLSEHLLSTDQARARMTTIIDTLLATPDAKGKKGPYAATTKLLELMSHRVQVLDLVDEYRRRKRSTDSLDFADQVELGARLAEQHDEVRAAERARYRVVLLDEYQDTSYAQARMLGALFGDGHAVTAVGDPNQSIYGWRGASASGLSRFAEQFSGLGQVHHLALSTSWRNDQAILDVANAVAAPLRDPAPERVAGAPAPTSAGDAAVIELHARPGAGPGHVTAAYTATEDEEAASVADFVARWWRPRTSRDGATTAAVLCRSRKQFAAVEVALRSRGIPVEVVGLGGLLEAPEVVDVVSLLQVVHDPSRGDSLMRLLTGPWTALGAADLFAVADRVRELSRRHAHAASRAADAQRESGTEPQPGSAEPGDSRDAVTVPSVVTEADVVDSHSIVDVLDELPAPGWQSPGGRSLTPDAHARLTRLSALLARLRASTYLSVPEIVVEAERALGLDIEAGLLDGPHAARARANLDAFRDLAISFVDGADLPTLGAFLSWLDVASTNERIDTAISDPDPDAVQIVTIHAAKGLEWDVVAVPGLVDGGLPSTACTGPQGPTDSAWLTGLGTLPYPLRGDARDLPRFAFEDAENHKDLDSLQKVFRQDAGAHQVTEERRLAYVAFTRARSRLLLTGSWFRGDRSSATPPSCFLTELADAGLVDTSTWTDEPEGANPALEREVTATWPAADGVDPVLASAAARVRAARPAAAQQAHDDAAQAGASGRTATAASAPGAARPADSVSSRAGSDDTVPLAQLAEILLTERDARRRPVTDVEIPAHVSASAMVRLAASREEYALSLRRPVPSEPSVHARRGTTFHAWVEQFYSSPVLMDLDDLTDADDTEPDTDLEKLRQTFLATPWASLDPIAVEVDIETPLAGVMTRSRIDAVFPDPRPESAPGQVVVVDWKTGREPTDPAAVRAREVQLAAYRLAWSRWTGTPLDDVDAAFCYLGDGVTRRPARLLVVDELEALLRG